MSAQALIDALDRTAAEFGHPAEETIRRENWGKHLLELNLLLKSKGRRVLDVGGGLGVNLIALAKLDQGIEVHLIDRFDEYREEMGNRMGNTDKAMKLLKNYGVKTETADILEGKLPYSDGYFDTVTCFDVIEHLPVSPVGLLKEIKRTLKTGGELILGAPNAVSFFKIMKIILGQHPYIPFAEWMSGHYYGHFREYNAAEYRSLLAAAGFSRIKVLLVSEPTGTRAKRAVNPIIKAGFLLLALLEILVPRLRPSVYCISNK